MAYYTPLDKATLLVGTVGAQITIRSVETDVVEIQFEKEVISGSMLEMAQPGENHGDVVLIGYFDNLFVAH